MCVSYRCVCFVLFFFFKQKTAYEMRISDWSSDVCSSDLCVLEHLDRGRALAGDDARIVERVDEGVAALGLQFAGVRISGVERVAFEDDGRAVALGLRHFHRRGVAGHDDGRGDAESMREIGRGSGRERGCQYVSI